MNINCGNLTAFNKHARKLKIANTRIIGSQRSTKFDGYVWGGAVEV